MKAIMHDNEGNREYKFRDDFYPLYWRIPKESYHKYWGLLQIIEYKLGFIVDNVLHYFCSGIEYRKMDEGSFE